MIEQKNTALSHHDNSIVIIIVVLCFTFLLLSCGESKEMKSERSKYELAEMKGDLDMMFISLRKLADLNDESAATQLPQVKTAIAIRERMFQAIADHDHEKAIRAGSELLYLFPENKEGLKVIRESGQIFYYLHAAKQLATSTLKENEPQNVDIEPFKIDPSLPPKERETKINNLIQTLLSSLGYYHGMVDGKAGPETITALKKFQSEIEKKEDLKLTEETVSILQKAVKLQEIESEHVTKRFHAITRAREFTNIAKKLDPHFERAIELDRILEQTHTGLVYLFANKIIDLGAAVVTISATLHNHFYSTLEKAANLPYLSISDIWDKISPFAIDAKRYLKNYEDKMDWYLKYIATYTNGEASKFIDVIKEYVATVYYVEDALLIPKGSLIDYRKSANNAFNYYASINNKLSAEMPNSARIEESFEGLISFIKDYELFEFNKTEEIINKHRELFTL